MNKKILMIAATPFFSDRGCHIRIYNEMKYLQKAWYQVRLTTYHLGNDIPWFDVKRSMNIPWYKKTGAGASWHKLYLDFLLLCTSIKEYFSYKPSFIHAHLYEWLLIAFFIKILSFGNIKIIFDCQWSLALEMQSYTLWKKKWYGVFYSFFVWLEKILLYIPDITLCSSQNSYHVLREKYQLPSEKIDILPDGIDRELFSNEKYNKEFLRREFAIPHGNKVLLYTGGITASKWIDVFLSSFGEILKINPNISCIIAGYGDLEDILMQKYSAYIVSGNLIFTGRFSYFDLPKLIAVSDVALEPKNGSSESSGKLYNYIAGKLWVICFESEFTRNVLGDSGIYIKDFREISQIMQKDFVPDYSNLDEISWKNIIEKYLLITQKYAK